MLLAGLLAVALLVLLGLVIRRRRQASASQTTHTAPEPSAPHESTPHESMLQHTTPLHAAHHLTMHHDSTPGADVLEAVGIYLAYGRLSEAAVLLREGLHKEPERIDLALQLLEVLGRQGDADGYNAHEHSLVEAGVDAEVLAEIRARYPKLAPLPAAVSAAIPSAAPVSPLIAAAVPMAAAVVPPAVVSGHDDFQLNLDDLSMDANWDLISPFDHAPAAAPQVDPVPAFTSNLHVLPDVFEFSKEPPAAELDELEWVADPEAQTLDDGFLDEFADDRQTLELEPLSLDTGEHDFSDLAAAPVGKLEQAQTCIDDGDIDSAIALLNELLREGDDQLKQTARSLLAGIR
jgi:FimV-like protein